MNNLMNNNFTKYKKQIIRILPQTQKSKSNIPRDKSRKALMPGKRISGTGKTYWETRKNRSDLKGSKL